MFQKVFEYNLNFSLKVLNIGEGHDVNNSGEINAVTLFNKLFKDTKRELVVFDVGAHYGEWASMFNANSDHSASIYSFEPSREAYKILTEKIINHFHPENIALSDFNHSSFLSASEPGSVTSRVVENNEKIIKGICVEKIETKTLDDYCLRNNINNIDFLKMDVEGYELKVISGAKDMIDKNRISLIQFEFGAESDEKYSLKAFFDLLGGKYHIYRLLKKGIYPIKKYKHYFEINTVTNFIAIRKDLINL